MQRALPLSALALSILLAAPAAAQSGAESAEASANQQILEQYADLETVTVTPAAAGAKPTIIWIAESGGTLYIRTNRRSAWGNAVERSGALSLTPPGDFTATRITDTATMDSVEAAFRKKYGFSDVMAGLLRALGGGPRIFRLHPNLPTPEAGEAAQ
ncbi:MAG: DUF2255 family protein [Deltaproteobacteria bacterium]|nr:DUF2255 family protein [Deltaproteobacteria bacterium]